MHMQASGGCIVGMYKLTWHCSIKSNMSELVSRGNVRLMSPPRMRALRKHCFIHCQHALKKGIKRDSLTSLSRCDDIVDFLPPA